VAVRRFPAPQRAAFASAVRTRKRHSSHGIRRRPLASAARERRESDAEVIVFVHDPLRNDAAAALTLRSVFGLTEAEADLARALQAGTTIGDYAAKRAVSLNTVYTHLRRIKEKTRCRRMPELIRKLNDLRLPARSG
jgi:DNA-binding CsgD family transcriptional regulator